MNDRRVFATKEEFDAYAAGVWKDYIYRFGDWEFNWCTRWAGGVHLSEQEADVLKVLLERMPLPLPLKDFPAAFEEQTGRSTTCDVGKLYVLRLRRRIGKERIINDGNGYRFVPFPEERSPS